MSVVVPSSQDGPTALFATLLFAFIPLLDTVLVLISRGLAGKPLLRGGTDHISHRMHRLGLSPAQTGLTLLALTGTVSLMGALLVCRLLSPVTALYGVLPAAVVLVVLLRKAPAYVTRAEDDRTVGAAQLKRVNEPGTAHMVVALPSVPFASETGTSAPGRDW
jgi:hypothetical protein